MPRFLVATFLIGLLAFTPPAHAATPHNLSDLPSGTPSRTTPLQPLTPQAALTRAVMPLVGFCMLTVAGLLPVTVGRQPLPLHRLLPLLLR